MGWRWVRAGGEGCDTGSARAAARRACWPPGAGVTGALTSHSMMRPLSTHHAAQGEGSHGSGGVARGTCAAQGRCKERRRWAGSGGGSSGDTAVGAMFAALSGGGVSAPFGAGRRSGGAPTWLGDVPSLRQQTQLRAPNIPGGRREGTDRAVDGLGLGWAHYAAGRSQQQQMHPRAAEGGQGRSGRSSHPVESAVEAGEGLASLLALHRRRPPRHPCRQRRPPQFAARHHFSRQSRFSACHGCTEFCEAVQPDPLHVGSVMLPPRYSARR